MSFKKESNSKIWWIVGLAAVAAGVFYMYKKKLLFFAPKAVTAIK